MLTVTVFVTGAAAAVAACCVAFEGPVAALAAAGAPFALFCSTALVLAFLTLVASACFATSFGPSKNCASDGYCFASAGFFDEAKLKRGLTSCRGRPGPG